MRDQYSARNELIDIPAPTASSMKLVNMSVNYNVYGDVVPTVCLSAACRLNQDSCASQTAAYERGVLLPGTGRIELNQDVRINVIDPSLLLAKSSKAGKGDINTSPVDVLDLSARLTKWTG